MRLAEPVMAVILGIFSIYLMVKSAELPVGWIEDEGPGGGAFPFWLAGGMLICTIWILINWFRGTSPSSQSSEPYMDHHSLMLFIIGAGSLGLMIAGIHFIGVYGSVPLFLIFYLRFVGHHSWGLTLLFAIATPIVTFLFFEVLLRITLPKGYTEPWFYPLYDFFY